MILIRHGQTEFNKDRRFQGQRDVPLNENGKDQALRAGAVAANLIAGEFKNKALGFFASDLSRAKETALIAQEIVFNEKISLPKLETSSLLREWHCGALEGFTAEEFEAYKPTELKNFYSRYENDPLNASYPGGECRSDVWKRVHEFMDDLEKRNNEVNIIVSHGGWIQSLLECMGIAKINEGKIIGNGDVLVLKPVNSDGLTGQWKSGWTIFRHYKIGTSVAANVTHSR